MERIELNYNSYKTHVLNSLTKNLQHQHIITSTGGHRYFFLFAPDGDAILYVSYINESTSTGQINITDYETNYADQANRQIEIRNKNETWFTSYGDFINELKDRNKVKSLNVKTQGDGAGNSYIINFSDGDQIYKYILDHSNTSEKNDFDINYLRSANTTLTHHDMQCILKHFTIEDKQLHNIWVPASNRRLQIISIYFHGYCDASSGKDFKFKIEAQTGGDWVEVAGITIHNNEESFRENIIYDCPFNIKKGNGADPRLRAKVTSDVTLGNFTVSLSITAFEAK